MSDQIEQAVEEQDPISSGRLTDFTTPDTAKVTVQLVSGRRITGALKAESEYAIVIGIEGWEYTIPWVNITFVIARATD